MRTLMVGLLLAAASTFLGGCGGSPSASSMKRFALKNAPEPEENKPPTAVPATPPPAASEPAPVNPAPQAPPAGASQGVGLQATASAPAGTVAAPPAPPPVELPKSKPIVNQPPEQPLSPAERRARSLANLESIGKAIALYAKRYQRLPPPAINNVEGEKMLSWRVAILPELGYADLKAKFRPHEPWDSGHNRQLLAQIPPEFQSPERFDTRTNYLGVSGIGMALGVPGGLPLASIKDGTDNTVAVLEVDDKYAQEWTQPVDFGISLEEPGDGVGALRGDGAFALLASGRAVLLPRDLPSDQWAALYTPSRGEAVVAADIVTAPLLDLPGGAAPAATSPATSQAQSAPSALATSVKPASATLSGASPPRPPTGNTGAAAFRAPALAPVNDPTKVSVPDEAELAKARELLKELYATEYADARTAGDRRSLIRKLLADARQVEANPADYYELLRISRDMAAANGDLPSVVEAGKLLEDKFQIDGLPARLKALSEVAKATRDAGLLAGEARRAMREAQDSDRYAVALEALDLALTSVRGQGDRAETARLQQQRQSLELAQGVYAKIPAAEAALAANPSDGAASEQIGKYLCCVKNEWDLGLPHLARAADIKFRVLAAIDLMPNRTPQETLSLGDQYWDLATTTKAPNKRGLHLRAVHCYALATAGLAGSLEKIKAQKRIDEAAALYGRDEVDRVLAPLKQARTGDSES